MRQVCVKPFFMLSSTWLLKVAPNAALPLMPGLPGLEDDSASAVSETTNLSWISSLDEEIVVDTSAVQTAEELNGAQEMPLKPKPQAQPKNSKTSGKKVPSYWHDVVVHLNGRSFMPPEQRLSRGLPAESCIDHLLIAIGNVVADDTTSSTAALKVTAERTPTLFAPQVAACTAESAHAPSHFDND
jgi:hypothetical protein